MQFDILTKSTALFWEIRCDENKRWLVKECQTYKPIEIDLTDRMSELLKLIRYQMVCLVQIEKYYSKLIELYPDMIIVKHYKQQQQQEQLHPKIVLEDYIEFISFQQDDTSNQIQFKQFLNPLLIRNQDTFSVLIPKVRIALTNTALFYVSLKSEQRNQQFVNLSHFLESTSQHFRVCIDRVSIKFIRPDQILTQFSNELSEFRISFAKFHSIRLFSIGYFKSFPSINMDGWIPRLFNCKFKVILPYQNQLPITGIKVNIHPELDDLLSIKFVFMRSTKERSTSNILIPKFLAYNDYHTKVLVSRQIADASIDCCIDTEEIILLITAIQKAQIDRVFMNSLFVILYDLRIDSSS